MARRSSPSLKGADLLGKIASGLVLPILGGFFLGKYVDEYFGTFPWITLILMMFGIISGFTWLYKSLNDDDKKQ
jgi:ATP synthase protein I